MNNKLPLDQCIGITETADASLHIEEWEENLKSIPMGILITKSPSQKFIKAALRNKDKLIIHFTVTGYAGTIVEPNTPKASNVLYSILDLIEKGFLSSQVVIRIDPVILTKKGIDIFIMVMEAIEKLNDKLIIDGFAPITRIRYSFIDMYEHVQERFKAKGLSNPYGGTNFAPTALMMNEFNTVWADYNNYLFESCAEDNCNKLGCISNRDLGILGLQGKIHLEGNAGQRKSCLCPVNKVQLIDFKKEKCPFSCLYCYWR